eukprot:869879-Amphidinium_carterae.1
MKQKNYCSRDRGCGIHVRAGFETVPKLQLFALVLKCVLEPPFVLPRTTVKEMSYIPQMGTEVSQALL